MKRFTRIFIRPHTEVDFYQPRQEFLDFINETYIKTGKCIKFREASYKDANQLVLELTSEWIDDVNNEIELTKDEWIIESRRELEYNETCEIILIEKFFTDINDT
jgi:hypothetical protein